MANIRNPQYGVQKDELSLTTQDPASILYGVTPSNKWIPIKITEDGEIVLGSGIVLDAGDLEIGAVEIKNYNTDDRAYISPAHEVLAQARLYDAAGTGITSTGGSLDVNITNSLTFTIDEATSDILVYGFDGSVNRAIKTNVAGELQVGITNPTLAVTQSGVWNINDISGTISLPTGAATESTLSGIKTQTDQLTFAATRLLVDGSGVTQPISAVSLPLPTGAATEATLATRATETTLSGFRTDFNAVDFATETTLASIDSTLTSKLDVALSTRASEATLATRASETTLSGFRTDFNAVDFSTETTLLAVKTDLDQFTFTTGSVNSNITNPTLAVTQSGAWSTGRTWALASGIDSVSAVQSGTWDINNISGVISLPTGASTSANQTNGSQKTQIVDGSGNVIGSTSNALDVNIKSGVTLEVNLDNANDDVLVYGFDGAVNQAIKTNVLGELQVGITNATLAVTQSGTWNINNISGTISLPTGAATESTLATRLADATFTARINTLGQKTMANSTPIVIASDQTAIPASQSGIWSTRTQDGSGNAITSAAIGSARALDTEQVSTANQTAAAANQLFSTSFDFNLASAGAETPILFLKNPNASGKTLIIKYIMVSGLSTANNEGVMALYANPTSSANGTSQTASTTSLGSGATAVATPFSGPTISVNGTRFLTWQVPSASQNTPTAQPINADGVIRVAPNNNLLITGKAAANNFNVSCSVIWQEI